jgi:hypothetical protein
MEDASRLAAEAASAAAAAPEQTRVVLSGVEFQQHLVGNEPLPSSLRQVLGPVSLRGCKIERLIEIRGVSFTQKVDFSNSTFERGLDLTGCQFLEKLVMANARVEGPLVLNKTVLGMKAEMPPDVRMLARHMDRLADRRRRLHPAPGATREERLRKLRLRLHARARMRQCRADIVEEMALRRPPLPTVADFTNLRVGGALSLVDAQVFGAIRCPHADIEDDFRIDGSWILGSLVLRRSSLGEFSTEDYARPTDDDSAEPQPSSPDGAAAGEQIPLPDPAPAALDGLSAPPAGAVEASSVPLRGEAPEHAARNPCFIGGDLDLTSTEVAGDIRLFGVSVRGRVSLQTAEIEGNVLCRAGQRYRTSLGEAHFLGMRVKGTLAVAGVRIYRDLNLIGAQVGGGVHCNFHGWVPTLYGSVYGSNSRIGTDADFSLARIRGRVILDSAHVGGNANLSGATLGDRVTLQGATVGGTLFCRTSDPPARTLPCRVGGDLWLLGAEIRGDVDLSGADVKKELVLQNATVGHNLIANVRGDFGTRLQGEATLSAARVSGAVLWVGATLDETLTLDGAEIGTDLVFTASREDETVTPCTLRKKLTMHSATVGGSVRISGATIEGKLEMQSATVGHHVHLCSAEGVRTVVKHGANLEGIRVSGDLRVAGATVEGALVVERASIGGNLKVVFDLVRTPEWGLERTCLGSLQGESASVGKDLVLMGAVVGCTAECAGWRRGADFSGIRVGGKLQFHRPEEGKDNLQAQKSSVEPLQIGEEREAQLIIQAEGERAEIHGNLMLPRAEVTGDLVLDDLVVHGDLDLRNARVGANLFCRAGAKRPEHGPRQPTARRADLEALEVSGDAELITLATTEDLVLRDCRIRGQLRLAAENEADGLARIGGTLDLDAAEIAHAVLSGANLSATLPIRAAASDPNAPRGLKGWVLRVLSGGRPEHCAAPRPARGILVLERASVRKLEIREPLPAELYLSDLKVASWDQSVDYFQEMLHRTRPFRKSCYVTIEGDLRNKGRDDDADKVHVWMRRRDRRNTTAILSVLWDRFLDVTTVYGTTSRRLFWLMLAAFSFSVFVFLDPSHVRYDIAPTAAHVPPPIVPVDSARWTPTDAVFMAVRLHVPIVSLGIDEPVQPMQTGVQIWALVAIAASWLMWPLFIASASGYLRRKT